MRLLQWVQGRAGLRDEQVSGWTDCASFGCLGGGGTHRNREGTLTGGADMAFLIYILFLFGLLFLIASQCF